MGKKNKRASYSENIDHDDFDKKIPASKGKKKKKQNISESNNVSFDNQIGSFLQDEQIINHSPKKRKSQKLMNMTLENKEADDLNLLETSDWSEEDTNKLLDIMENLRPNLQNRSYKVTLHKMDFDKVSNLMKSNKTSEDCRQHFELLIAKINKVKSLAQIISETREKMSTSTIGKEKSPYSLFWEANKDTICSMAKQNKMNIMKISHQLWKELPEVEKLCYKEKSEILKTAIKQVQNVGEYVNPVNSPFQFFLVKYRKKYPSSSYADGRIKFSKMDISKKLKFIIKSFETLYLEKEALEKYAEMYPDRPAPKKNLYHYPNYEEIKHYYHSYLGLHEMPSKSLPLFAAKEAGLTNSKLIAATVRFKNYDSDAQREWHLKFTKAWKDYTEQLNEWISRQDPRDVELMEKWSFLTKIPKIDWKVKAKHGRIKSVEKKKAVEKVFKEVVMPVTINKFDNEPQLPPLSNMTAYDEFLKKEGEVVKKSELMEKYKNLSEVEKKSVEEWAAHIRKRFIKRIKRYVGDMTEEMRKLYLGLKRKKLISSLKEDIFVEIYPDDQYPVYVKQLTIDNCETSKFEQNDDISPPRKKGKKNLLPLESDMLDTEPQHKSISKSKMVEPMETSASESEEHLTDTLSEPSIRKLKKRKISSSPHKKIKNSESSSADSEDDNGSSAKVKKALGSNTFSTQSPPKLRRKSSESSSESSENEEKRNLNLEMSKNLEESSSEEEDVFETWLSKSR